MNHSIWMISKYANIAKYGADTRQSYLCQEFAKNGYKTSLIISDSSHLYSTLPRFWATYKQEQYHDVNVVWINTIKYSNATSFMRMLSWTQFELFVIFYTLLNFKKSPATVVASSLSLLSVLSGVFIKNIFKSKFIFEVRDIWPQTLIDLKNMNPNSLIIRILKKVEKIGYSQANAIVGTMPGLKLHVEKILSECSDKVYFIPQGYSDAFYANQKEISLNYQKEFLLDNKFKVMYTGTLGQAYALDSIIEAAAKMQNTFADVQLIFVGDGIEKDKLLKKSKNLTNVTFAPRVKKSEVLSVLSKADLLLHSFKMKPVFEYGISPNKFIDYMYAEKPIICMFSGYQSILNESGCGVFIDSEDSEALIDEISRFKNMSQAEREVIGKKGSAYLQNHQKFCQLADQYIELFKV